MRSRPSSVSLRLLSFLALFLLTATIADAQFGRGGFFGFGAGRIAQPEDFDGRFHYCRVVYRQALDGAKHLLVNLGGPELFGCPVVIMSAPGAAAIDEKEAANLRTPILHTQFEVNGVPQIPNIGFYMRSGGRTSEQGADSATPHFRGIADRSGRIMVLMTHNTDIGDSWERENDDPRYFMACGPKGYALGINAFLYALTH